MAASRREVVRLRLSDEEIHILIELFHEHDCLWNLSSDVYHKKEHRQTALRAMSAALQTRTDKFLCAEEIWQKLRNLRTTYTRERRKVELTSGSGAGTDMIHISTWPFYTALDEFLRPHISMRSSVPNLYISEGVTLVQSTSAASTSPPATASTSASTAEEYDASIPVIYAPMKRKRDETLIDSAGNTLSAAKRSLPPQDSPTLIFAKHLANELDAICSVRLRKQVQLQLQQCILDAQLSEMEED